MNPNNPPILTPPPSNLDTRRLILVLAAGIGFILIIVLISYSFTHKKAASILPAQDNGQSAAAGQPTPTPTPTPTPQNAAAAPVATPTYTNFDALTDTAGYTANQLEDLQFALLKFGRQIGLPGASIVLNAASVNVVAPNPNSPTAATGLTVTFNITYAGRAPYKVSTLLSSPTAVTTTIANATTGAQVFNSGSIDLYNGIGD